MRLAVFDVDGTLVDSQHNIVAAMTAAMAANGFAEPPALAIRRIIGLSMLEAVATLIPGAGADQHMKVAMSCKAEFYALRARKDFHEPLFDGAAEALAAFDQAGWLLGVATGKSLVGVEAMLERHDLVGRFVTLQTADNHPGKPHPSMVRQAMSETGVPPEATVMIGDTAYDMMMGRSADVRAVGVAWGYHPPAELLAAGANAIVDTYSELPSVASQLIGRATCASALS